MGDRRSFWAWCMESEEPTDADRAVLAAKLSAQYGTEITAGPVPRGGGRRAAPPADVRAGTFGRVVLDVHVRSGLSLLWRRFTDRCPACARLPEPARRGRPPRATRSRWRRSWPGATAATARSRTAAAARWSAASPRRRTPGPVVTIALDELDKVLEVDDISRAARIQAGVFGPHLEDQLRPRGYTLRHFPQSFTGSTLGGWIATRSGGHYATNHTHIDEFVETARMITPRLVGGPAAARLGAGPDPNRLVIGSEGILGIITEAWMRIQARPRFRGTAGIRFPTWEAGYEATRHIAQAKLWPANLRLLDPELAAGSAGLDGTPGRAHRAASSRPSCPSACRWSRPWDRPRARRAHRDADELLVDDGTGEATGRSGAAGAWRSAFIPSGMGLTAGLGLIGGTFETAITWDRWPAFDAAVREAARHVLQQACGGGTVNCRFTHVYTDGPAPYYTWARTAGTRRSRWAADQGRGPT